MSAPSSQNKRATNDVPDRCMPVIISIFKTSAHAASPHSPKLSEQNAQVERRPGQGANACASFFTGRPSISFETDQPAQFRIRYQDVAKGAGSSTQAPQMPVRRSSLSCASWVPAVASTKRGLDL
jgi:hypothetical protein